MLLGEYKLFPILTYSLYYSFDTNLKSQALLPVVREMKVQYRF